MKSFDETTEYGDVVSDLNCHAENFHKYVYFTYFLFAFVFQSKFLLIIITFKIH